jgi:hypothetical protein
VKIAQQFVLDKHATDIREVRQRIAEREAQWRLKHRDGTESRACPSAGLGTTTADGLREKQEVREGAETDLVIRLQNPTVKSLRKRLTPSVAAVDARVLHLKECLGTHYAATLVWTHGDVSQ